MDDVRPSLCTYVSALVDAPPSLAALAADRTRVLETAFARPARLEWSIPAGRARLDVRGDGGAVRADGPTDALRRWDGVIRRGPRRVPVEVELLPWDSQR